MKSVVVIPTYNERENIGLLVDDILALPLDIQVIVVDDNSPDGTGELLDDMAFRVPALHVIHRPGKLLSADLIRRNMFLACSCAYGTQAPLITADGRLPPAASH